MVWRTTCLDGAQSAAANVSITQDNTDYIQKVMGDVSNNDRDHFWNIDEASKDGRHRQVQMQNFADIYSGAPTTPTLATGMDLALSVLTNGSLPEVVLKNSSGIMQLLGIRAYAIWTFVAGGDPTTQTLLNSYNVSLVQLQSDARFKITFATALPNENYVVFCGGMSQSGNSEFNITNGSVPSGTAVTARKRDVDCLMVLRTGANAVPSTLLQGWFLAFGG